MVRSISIPILPDFNVSISSDSLPDTHPVYAPVSRPLQLPRDRTMRGADSPHLSLRTHPAARTLRQERHVARVGEHAGADQVLDGLPDRKAQRALGGRSGHQPRRAEQGVGDGDV